MNYTAEGTTNRYSRNRVCKFDSFVPSLDDTYQYGCEFEFYIDTNKHDYSETVFKITQELYLLSHADILVDMVALPTAKDKDLCLQIKPDTSLKSNGVEISIPISTAKGVIHFIKSISPIIEYYGYTNEETGLHIHISTIKKDGINFNFYKYMLICDNAKLLSSWKTRTGYSQNVMDILSSNNKLQSKEIKTKKGTVWNLEKIENNHVEIKTIGGDNYHHFIPKLISEFEQYSKYFHETLQCDTFEDKELFKNHLVMVKNAKVEAQSKFDSALVEAGIKSK